MLFLIISFVPFVVLLLKSLSLPSLPLWTNEMRVLPALLSRESVQVVLWLKNTRQIAAAVLQILSTMVARRKIVPKVEPTEEAGEMSVLELPELTLECILERLSPAGLCNMAAVCSSLRDRCTSDYLWRRHMNEKWGDLLSDAAEEEWRAQVSLRQDCLTCGARSRKHKGWLGSLSCTWPLSLLTSKLDGGHRAQSCLPVNSIMSWYLALETGRFIFPAQVYNREHGHVGFMLSCYDAQLSYCYRTDDFIARYPPHGRRTTVMEEGVKWDRIRAPPVETPPHDLHISDCLQDLRPGDHIEIQWRRNKDFPYGWWYGIVGHLDSCVGREFSCRCHTSETVILEFNQYAVGSRWRQATINRKEHREEGNETDGFYGGIRKIRSKEEIAMWRRVWPSEVLE